MLNIICFPIVSFLSDIFLGLYLVEFFKIERLNPYLKLLLSFYISFFLKALVYFFVKFTNSYYLIKQCFCVFSFVGFAYFVFCIYKKTSNRFINCFFCVNLVILFFLFSLMTVYNYNGIFNYQDFIWHMGNINILSSPFFHDYRLHEVIFTYHYFSDLHLAFYKILFNIDARHMVYFLPCIIFPLLYALTIEGVAEHYAKICNKTISRVLLFLSLTSVTLINGNQLLNNMWLHSLTNVNGMSFTLPLVFLLLIFVEKFFCDKSFSTCCMIAILLAVLTGSKGPVAIVIYVSLVLSLLYYIFIDRSNTRIKENIQLIICSIFSFVLVYVNLLRHGASDASTSIRLSRAFEVVSDCECFHQMVISLSEIVPRWFAKGLLVFPHFLLSTGILGVLALIVLCYKIFKKEKIDSFSLFLIISGVIGIGGTYFVSHDGKSQLYFLFGCFPVLAIGIIINLKTMIVEKMWKRHVAVVAIVLLLPTVGVVYNNVKTQHISYSFDLNQIGISRNLSSEELEGLLFVKEKIPSNALLATNRHYLGNDNNIKSARYFYDSAYSGRQYWIEGYYYAKNSGFDVSRGPKLCNYNDMLFNSTIEETKRVKQAKEMNVNYLVVHKKFSNVRIVDASLFKVLFENNSILIVKIL